MYRTDERELLKTLFYFIYIIQFTTIEIKNGNNVTYSVEDFQFLILFFNSHKSEIILFVSLF